MSRRRVLLSEASSLTAREFVTVLGSRGVDVEVVTSAAMPIAKFSRWCRGVHYAPAPSVDPVGYLREVDALMASGRFDALLPTHEQAWLFAAGRHLLPHASVAVASFEAFDKVESKVAFAKTLDELNLPQPRWRLVGREDDLDALGFPVWLKAAYSTAGRGVRHAQNHQEAAASWTELGGDGGEVMLQEGAAGTYGQVQGLFEQGRLVAAAISEQVAVGAGGSAAARLSVDHPAAVEGLRRLGVHLDWHGGLDLDYFHVDGQPMFIECNARLVEPGNAAAAGVDLPSLLLAMTAGTNLPQIPQMTRAGVTTRSTMAIALGAAERIGTRRAILTAVGRAVARSAPLEGSSEVLTPVLRDFPSIVPFTVATALVLTRPSKVAGLAGDTVSRYRVTRTAVEEVRARN